MIDIDALQQHMEKQQVPADEQAATLAEAHRRNAAEAGVHSQAPGLTGPMPGRIDPARLPAGIAQNVMQREDALLQPVSQRPPTGAPQQLPGVLPMVGQYLGGAAAAAASAHPYGRMAALAIPAMATAGDLAGYTLESILQRGEFPSMKELMVEGSLTALPEFAETGVRSVMRAGIWHGARQGLAGKYLRQSAQYRKATAAAMGVFNAPSKDQVDSMFQQLRASGKKLDMQGLADMLKEKYAPGWQKTLMYDMSEIDGIINQRTGRVGDRRFRELYEQVLKYNKPVPKQKMFQEGLGYPVKNPPPLPKVPPQIDLGDAQDLRSGLRVLTERYGDAAASNDHWNVLNKFKYDVDDMILNRLTAQGHETDAQALLEARKAYHRYAAAEDLSEFLLRHSTPLVGRSGTVRRLDLNKVVDDLEKNSTWLAQNLNRHLDAIPDARAAFNRVIEDLAPLNRYIEISGFGGEGVKNLPFVSSVMRGVSEGLLSHEGARELVTQTLQNQGRLTPNIIAPVVGLARRTTMTPEQQEALVPSALTNEDLLQQIRTLMQGNVRPAE